MGLLMRCVLDQIRHPADCGVVLGDAEFFHLSKVREQQIWVGIAHIVAYSRQNAEGDQRPAVLQIQRGGATSRCTPPDALEVDP